MYSITANASDVQLNRPVTVTATMVNDWQAVLRDPVASLDLSDAPHVAFRGRPGPVLGQLTTGNLAFDPQNITAAERNATVTVTVPEAATEARITLTPTTSGADGPDLGLRAWPGRDPASPTHRVDVAGAGEPEVLHLDSAELIDRSWGPWSIQTWAPGLLEDPRPAALQDQSFSVTLDAWFNTTDDQRVQRVSSTAELDGKQSPRGSIDFAWTVFVVENTPVPEDLTITVNATAFHDHPDQFTRFNDWPFTQSTQLTIHLPGLVGNVTGNQTGAPKPDTVVRSTLEEDSAEWVGTIAAVMVALSFVTGGIFGRRNRRVVNAALGGARNRLRVHEWSGWVIVALALIHTGLFVHEPAFHYAVGLLWGSPAILALAGLGLTGAFQRRLVAWSRRGWLWLHIGFAFSALAFTVVHILLDGIHFEPVQDRLGWSDPVVDELRSQ